MILEQGQRVNKQAEHLKALALNPAGYGETVEVRLTSDGGLTLTPLFSNNIPDDTRMIILDSTQARMLAARVMVDPEYAAAIVAAELLSDAKGKLGNLTIWSLMALLAAVAFAAGAVLY